MGEPGGFNKQANGQRDQKDEVNEAGRLEGSVQKPFGRSRISARSKVRLVRGYYREMRAADGPREYPRQLLCVLHTVPQIQFPVAQNRSREL